MKPNIEIPRFIFNIPTVFQVVESAPLPEELRIATEIRDKFSFPNTSEPYMIDIIRAFRIARGSNVYIEVGTRDKGNIAWLSRYLASDAHIIDVDLEQVESAKQKLLVEKKPTQNITFIEGDSIAAETISQVKDALCGSLADVIFLDSSHMYLHFLSEVTRYWDLLKPGGFMMTHDILWEGNEDHKGKAQAAAFLDRHIPVYLVSQYNPVTRFAYESSKHWVWGGVGIIIKPL